MHCHCDPLRLGVKPTSLNTGTQSLKLGVWLNFVDDLQPIAWLRTGHGLNIGTILNASGQKVETDAYFNLSGISYSSSSVYLGTEGTNYYATYYAYDVNGNLNRTEDPSGTIYRTVFDGQGRVVSKWVGTNDMPTSGAWSPSNPAGMVEVESDVYDGGGVGDGDLTQETHYTGEGGSDPNEVIDYFYDWRDWLVAEKDGVQSSESTSVNRPITYNTYNNLNEITEIQTFDGDG